MKMRIQRWGNSLAVRIPRSRAQAVGPEQDSLVDVRRSRGKLVLEPSAPAAPTLDALLARVSASNLHRAVETGPAQGRESW